MFVETIIAVAVREQIERMAVHLPQVIQEVVVQTAADAHAFFVTVNGQQRSMADFRGKVVAMFFGFVQCPDVCPTTLAEMVQVRELLGADADKLQVLFVTVDPERDTAQILKEYLGNFDPSFLALLPTPEELRTRIAPDFKVYYKKIEGSTPTSSTMDHTAGVLLFDPKGKVRLHSSYGSPAASIAADIQALLAEG